MAVNLALPFSKSGLSFCHSGIVVYCHLPSAISLLVLPYGHCAITNVVTKVCAPTPPAATPRPWLSIWHFHSLNPACHSVILGSLSIAICHLPSLCWYCRMVIAP